MFKLQDNNDVLKRLMLLKSMIVHSRLFHIGTTCPFTTSSLSTLSDTRLAVKQVFLNKLAIDNW